MMKNLVLLFAVVAALFAMVPGTASAADASKGSAEALKKEAQDTLEAAKKFAEKEKQEYHTEGSGSTRCAVRSPGPTETKGPIRARRMPWQK